MLKPFPLHEAKPKRTPVDYIEIKDVVLYCPKCGEQLGGFVVDPRGHDTKCEHCDELLHVNMSAEIGFDL